MTELDTHTQILAAEAWFSLYGHFTDINQTAEVINTVTNLFYLPIVMPMFTLEEFERNLNSC